MMNLFDSLGRRKAVLYVFAAIGFFVLNAAFIYYAIAQPHLMDEAMANPIALVFMLEAFALVGFFAWLIVRAGLKEPGALAFIVLSIIGSMAFSVPAFLIWHIKKRDSAS